MKAENGAEARARAEARCEKLRSLLRRYEHDYYVLGEALVPDAEYDGLLRELERLEKEHGLQRPDSPSVRVGGGVGAGFVSLRHGKAMLSLDNAFSIEEMRAFDVRLRDRLQLATTEIEYAAEPKIDGVALNLCYRDGVLESAATRGDGTVGEDVSSNARVIGGVPLRLQAPGAPRWVEVRGEVYLGRAAFASLNQEQLTRGDKPFANPRNAAAGGLRCLDPAITRKRCLRFVAHGIGELEGPPLARHSELLECLAAWGLPVPKGYERVRGTAGCEGYFRELTTRRASLDFEMDGAVFKVDRLDWQKQLGTHAKAPRWAISWKFPSPQKETKLLKITLQVGRTGALTPVADLQTVSVGGVRVNKASLHNRWELRRKDIRVGDSVKVRRAGEVIPEIIRVVIEQRPENSRVFPFPAHCPSCGSALNLSSGEAADNADQCPEGDHCPAQLRGRILHFASRNGLNIQGVGGKLVDRLMKGRLLNEPLDLFRLDFSALQRLERMGELSIRNLESALRKARETTLARLLYALGLPEVGAEMARRLADFFGALTELAAASPETLLYLEGIGTKSALRIHDFFLRENASRQAPGAEQPSLEHRLRGAGLNWPERVAAPLSRIQPLAAFQHWLGRLRELDDLPGDVLPGRDQSGEEKGWAWEITPGTVCKILQATLERHGGVLGTLLDLDEDSLAARLRAVAEAPEAARAAFACLRAPRQREAMRQLRRLGLDWQLGRPGEKAPQPAGGRLAGKMLVLTGSLPGLPREELKRRILEAGGQVKNTLSSRTDYLVVGRNPGEKLARAKALGVSRLAEEELLEWLG